MRAYSFCLTHNFLYVIAPESPHYERYFRSHLKYELAPLDAKAERLFKEKKRLASEIAATYAKTTRLRKQYRAIMKKLRDLGSREDRNILELEMNEVMVSDLLEMSQKGVISSGALNSPSPRFSFFLDPALLGSPGRSVKVPQGSS
jgi:tRNA(Ile)-lysidine synthase TilS/MesJ